MTCDFTYKHYKEILKKVKSCYYYRFDEYKLSKESKKAIFLRHDVDSSLEHTLRIGKIEHSLGIPSTFFIRVHAIHYNPISYNSIKIVKQLIDMGHEIGIHLEHTFCNTFRIEKEMLEHNYDIRIKSRSTHEPRGEQFPSLGLNDAYSPKFFKHMKYLSDSAIIPLTKGRWRKGCPCQTVDKYDRIQLLTHPIHWYNESSLENY